MPDKPFSQACENNKRPILQVLTRVLADSKSVLEIGSGTGQHAAFFTPRLPHLEWQTSDLPDNHGGIKSWLEDEHVENLYAPLSLKIGLNPWPSKSYDAVFTANTTHIMQPSEAQLMMQLVAENLPEDGLFCQYGPFKFRGHYTSESNGNFDQHLIEQGCGGIRDVQDLTNWAKPLNLVESIPMPANNFLLVWQKSSLI